MMYDDMCVEIFDTLPANVPAATILGHTVEIFRGCGVHDTIPGRGYQNDSKQGGNSFYGSGEPRKNRDFGWGNSSLANRIRIQNGRVLVQS